MTRPGRQTPSQTVGPFFRLALGRAGQNELVPRGFPGAIRIEGRVLDGDRQPVSDALLELWQADAEGRYLHPSDRWPPSGGPFTGFGRATTDAQGTYFFETRKPGRARTREGILQAPHASLVILARGLLGHLYTRVYFDDEAEENAQDPVLSGVTADRRGTLIAAGSPREGGSVYRFDVILHGEAETVFFDV